MTSAMIRVESESEMSNIRSTNLIPPEELEDKVQITEDRE